MIANQAPELTLSEPQVQMGHLKEFIHSICKKIKSIKPKAEIRSDKLKVKYYPQLKTIQKF